MRIYQDQIVAATATGVICLFIGFASIAEMSERPGAFGWAVMLGVAMIAALIIGIILYRGQDSPRAADVWSLVVLGGPSLLLAFFSYTFTKQFFGLLWALGVWISWIAAVMMRITLKQRGARMSAAASKGLTTTLAVAGLVAVFAIGVRTFVLVISNLFLACLLAFLAAGSAKNLLK